MTLHRIASHPTWLLGRANTRAQSILSEAFSSAGVRGYHYRLLAALEQHGPSSQMDLGRSAGIDRSDVVATLNDLVGWGFARREPDPVDRRRNVVSLSETGMARLEALDHVLADAQQAVLEPLTQAERGTLERLLTKLA